MSPREQKEATTYSLSDLTWTLLCGLPSKGHAVTWHHVHLILVSFAKRLSQQYFLCTQCLQLLQKMLLLPTPVRQMADGNSPELCRGPDQYHRSSSSSFLCLLGPFSSIASFQAMSLLTHSLSDSAMTTRSSAYRSSKRTPEWNRVTKFQAQWWRAAGRVRSLGEHRPSLQTLHWNLSATWLLSLAYILCTNPLVHTKFSQRPPDDLSRQSIKGILQVNKSHVEALVGS